MDPNRLRDKIKSTFDSFGMLPESMWDGVISDLLKTNVSPTQFLLEKGIIFDPKTGIKMADYWNISYQQLRKEDVDMTTRARLPEEIVRSWKILPVGIKGDKFLVAVSDPLVVLGIDKVERELGMRVDLIFTPEEELEKLVKELYPEREEILIHRDLRVPEKKVERREELGVELDLKASALEEVDAPIITLIEEIVVSAYKWRASDIHIEPFAEFVRIRYRIDGILHEIDRISKEIHGSMISRIKIMANMDIAEKRLPQDGRILFEKNGLSLDLRVSTLNTSYGETVVIRILDKSRGLMSLSELGMDDDTLREFRRLINLPYGMVLVTGPTGSGKSTTLYSALSEIDHNLRKVITVEDPVEYQIPGINQVQVRPVVGLTFASALRSILRQAPDVILVGEIRDKETAQIAVQAALTGHLVLSTLHTNDAPSSITRLIDMGIPPYLVASCIAGVLAQRLVRKLCPDCRKRADLGQEETSFLRGERVKGVYRAVGCEKCRMTGYRGRIGIFELMSVNSDLRDSISRGEPVEELRLVAERSGMRSLREDGLRKVEEGITTISEIMRIVR